MVLKNLPISSQVFDAVIGSGSLYVDKTGYIHKMATKGHNIETGITSCPKFFLSRPRRFGKSMTVSTLKAIFEGKKELFEGLSIGNTDYRFEPHPILKLDFSEIEKTPELLEISFGNRLSDYLKQYGLPTEGSISDKTHTLMTGLGEKKWVVLIDEYDAPILDALKEDDERVRVKKCQAVVEALRRFYLVIKANDANLRLVFITGVSKFSQVSVFSGLNNLQDISVDEDYAGLCGYTQEELENNFEPYIQRLADKQTLSIPETLEKLKYYYNGYRFSPDTDLRVYNPFSVLNSFENKRFDTKWFQSGTPSFLVEWISRENYPVESIEGQRAESGVFDAREPHQMDLLGMMIQTGYLTIRDYDSKSDRYILDYPNYEVKKGFLNGLLEYFKKVGPSILGNQLDHWRELVEAEDWDGFFAEFNQILSSVPYYIHMPTEAYYHSIFHCTVALLGLRIQSELATSRGRIDTFIETQEANWIFEFKVAKEDGEYGKKIEEARRQVEKQGYRHYLTTTLMNKPLKVMGVVFDIALKTVVRWEVL